jgi:hypothetical protein
MIELRIPLLNAATSDTLDFGAGFLVRHITDMEGRRWMDDPFVRDVVPHRVLPTINSVLVFSGHLGDLPGHSDKFEEALMVWFGLTSLWASRAVEAAFCEEWDVSAVGSSENATPLGSSRYFSLALPVAESPPWNGPIQLEWIAAPVSTLLPKFQSETPFTGTFRYALARWFSSLNKHRRTIEDAIVDLSMALEALFVLDEERDGTARLMRERISHYWCRDGATKKELRTMKDHVVNIYDVRSRIVHGRIVDADKLDAARKVLDQIVRAVIVDFANGELDDFDPRTFWNLTV